MSVAALADGGAAREATGAAGLSSLLARGDVWRGDHLAHLPETGVATGYPELDAELPGGGWPRGSLTELLVERPGIGELSLLLPALAGLSAEEGWLALVAPPWLPHAPAWQAAGLDLERLVVVEAGREAAWCCEQLLLSGGFAGVLAWLGAEVNARTLRRLQVAAEGQPTLACLWRPVATAATPSPASLRVALEAGEGGLQVRVLKRRGRPAARPLLLKVPRPGRLSRALVRSSLSLLTPRSTRHPAVA